MNLDRIPPQPPMTDALVPGYLEALRKRLATPEPGDTRACPDCGRPQHYTGTEYGWAHDALVDTWHCADPQHYRPPQRCLNCGARGGEPCEDWCAYKPAGRAMP